MRDLIIKPAYTKNLGILLLVSEVGGAISEIITQTLHNNKLTFLFLIMTISPISIGISMLIKDRKKQEIVFSVGLFVIAVIQLIKAFGYKFSIILALVACAYAALGIISVTGFKKVKVGVYITLGLIFENLLYSSIAPVIMAYAWGTGKLSYYGYSYAILSTLELVCILIYFAMHLKPKKQSDVVINSDVLDFKTLLQFIENEYSEGKISEAEYVQKRSEILSKI